MTAPALNVLILSCGRRVELVRAFKTELEARLPGARVLATDLKPETSAACHAADRAFTAPRVTDSGYHDFLLDLCMREGVGLVVPTIDTELLGLALSRDRFATQGVELIISSETLVSACRDKRQTSTLFTDVGIEAPLILERNALKFPCFVKPYDGSRSVGAMLLPDSQSVTPAILDDLKMMFMEFIDGTHQEYTVDAYYDRHGTLKCMVPRERLEVRDGEVNKGVTRKNYVYRYLVDKLSKVKGARGCLTVQLFAKAHGPRYAALEINPRFGGGFPRTYAAGGNYPGWLIDEYLLGKEVEPFDKWESDLLMLRYDAKIMVHGQA